MELKTDVLVLGGGISGLAAAGRLKAAGLRTAVLEKDPQTGGLSRTARAGNFSFDLGGHRLYFSKPGVRHWTEDLLKGGRLLRPRRSSAVFTGGRMLRYPPTFLNGLLYAAPLLLQGRRRKSPAGEAATLKDWLEKRLGAGVHDRYFRDYTRKVWGLGTEQLSPVWAERRIGGGFSVRALLLELFGGDLASKENVSRFLYPEKGIGELPDALRADAGENILTGARPLELLFKEGRPAGLIYSLGGTRRQVAFKALVSTIPLSSLLALLPALPGANPAALRYRSLVVLFAALRRKKPLPYHWVYFPDADAAFSRACELANWSPLMAPDGWLPLTFEFFCDEGDSLWNISTEDLALLAFSSPAMKRLAGEFEAGELAVERLPHAYPLLYCGGDAPLAAAKTALAAFPNLFTCGRTGGHAYMDTEECLLDSWAAADKVKDFIRGS
ncbi:MAG: FAD-dependent oxidoreductase [Elusimicrobiales bacterium]|nr:FAD-dependent oxidoreductase [Elusimicrobiales bacterium]